MLQFVMEKVEERGLVSNFIAEMTPMQTDCSIGQELDHIRCSSPFHFRK